MLDQKRSSPPVDGDRLGPPVPWLLGIAGCLVALAALLIAYRARFDWALDLAQIPALQVTAGLVVAGLVFLLLPHRIRQMTSRPAPRLSLLLPSVLAVGLLLRLMMLWTEPVLEDDQQRYLFEGGMVAHGFSPYRHSPADAKAADRTSGLGRLAETSQSVLDRVNHPALKTIYPPVAQAAFALSYVLGPLDLTVWRLLLIACECAMVAMLLQLLVSLGTSPLWIALYWWNPLPIKEIANSGHMEAVLMVLVVASLWLAIAGRHLLAALALGLAVGVKIWPLLLAPLLLRPLLGRPRTLLAAAGMLAGLSLLWAWPIVAGGLDERSGFVAYAERWQANGALLPFMRGTLRTVSAWFGLPLDLQVSGRIARAILAATAATAALLLAWRPIASADDLVRRVAALTLVLVLVSPAQFPWYMLWTLPFVVLVPRWSVLAMAVMLPLYYTSFYFSAHGIYEVFRDRIVWAIWLPIWSLVAWEIFHGTPLGGGRACTRTGN